MFNDPDYTESIRICVKECPDSDTSDTLDCYRDETISEYLRGAVDCGWDSECTTD